MKILLLLPTVILFSSCDFPGPTPEHEETCPAGYSSVQFRAAIICASNDYYLVNGIRTPVGLTDALRIAEERNSVLPTVEMVDAIYAQADIRLSPIPMPPGPQMTSVEYYEEHDRLIDDLLPLEINGLLIAGHKKDLIRIDPNSSRVAIYGWHRGANNPIQPYSTVHGREYYDYSHGLRLIYRYGFIDGIRVNLNE